MAPRSPSSVFWPPAWLPGRSSSCWALRRQPADPRLHRGLHRRPRAVRSAADEVVFAAAHNSMSAADIAGWMFPNQERARLPLGDGIRALLFDVHYGAPVGDRVKTLLEDEDAARAKYEEALGRRAGRGDAHPRPAVGAPKGERTPTWGTASASSAPPARRRRSRTAGVPGETRRGAGPRHRGHVTPADSRGVPGERVQRFVYRAADPAMADAARDDRRRPAGGGVRRERDAGVPWYHPPSRRSRRRPTRSTAEEFSCRPNRGGRTGPLFQINHWIETTPTPNPANAAIVNACDVLLARAPRCQQERGMLPNILAVDFAGTGDVVGVAAELNGLAPPGAAR